MTMHSLNIKTKDKSLIVDQSFVLQCKEFITSKLVNSGDGNALFINVDGVELSENEFALKYCRVPCYGELVLNIIEIICSRKNKDSCNWGSNDTPIGLSLIYDAYNEVLINDGGTETRKKLIESGIMLTQCIDWHDVGMVDKYVFKEDSCFSALGVEAISKYYYKIFSNRRGWHKGIISDKMFDLIDYTPIIINEISTKYSLPDEECDDGETEIDEDVIYELVELLGHIQSEGEFFKGDKNYILNLACNKMGVPEDVRDIHIDAANEEIG
jgi:hypothetical protein